MKVICINNKPINGFKNKNLSHLTEGETYIVTKKYLTASGRYNYHLQEVNYFYSQVRFIPCSDIDEKELVNQKEEVEI